MWTVPVSKTSGGRPGGALEEDLPEADPVHKITIIPRGQALGAMMSLPKEDRFIMSCA